MSGTRPTPSKLKTRADYKAAVNALLVDIRRLEARWQEREAEEQRLKAETQIYKDLIDANLAQIDEILRRLSKA